MNFKRSKFGKRIRKKKGLGEFRRFGFSIDIYCGPDLDGKIVDQIIGILISKRMYCSGGGDIGKYQFFVDGIKEESDRDWVCDQIIKIEGVTDVVHYGIVDIGHDNADLYFEGIGNLRKEYGKER